MQNGNQFDLKNVKVLENAYKTEIDYDYLKAIEGDNEALFKYIEDEFIHPRYKNDKVSVRNQCRAMMKICELLGLQPSADQFIFIMTDYRFVNNQAVAGAGKTSFSQLRAIKEKLINKLLGRQILCIAYNKEAEQDMRNRHRSLIEKYNNYYRPKFKAKYRGILKDEEIEALLMDTYIETYTFHSFAYNWIDEYKDEFPDIIRIKDKDFLMTDTAVFKMMSSALEMWFDDVEEDKEKYKGVTKVEGKGLSALVGSLVSLYQWRAETLDFNFKTGCNNNFYGEVIGKVKQPEFILEIFSYYERLKRRRCVIDFSDVLNIFYEFLKQPKVLQRIRSLYRYIIFDEFQDVSNSMLRTLYLIANGDEALGIPGDEGIKITIIGDIDQCLYEFRGVSVDNSLKFKDLFGSDDTKIVSMSANRRCLAPIVELSAEIIEPNKQRIKKPIVPLKGYSILEEDAHAKSYDDCIYKAVEIKPYKVETDYISEILDDLSKMNSLELRETAIIFRNKSSSIITALELFKNGVPFTVNKGISPYQDTLSVGIAEAFDILARPTNMMLAEKVLPKLLPKFKGMSSNHIRQVCKKEKELYDKDKDATAKPFWDYNFGDAANHSNFASKLEQLKHLSKRIRSGESMMTLVRDIYDALDLYSMRFSENMPADNCHIRILENFLVDKTWQEFNRDLNDKLAVFRERSEDFNTVKLTTFHSTKGLEYNNVYIIDMDDGIFPGIELEDCKGNPELEANAIESCRRLLYVAVTRARNKLKIFVNANNPSRFIFDIDKKYYSDELKNVLESVKTANKPVFDDVSILKQEGGNAVNKTLVKGMVGVVSEVPDELLMSTLNIAKVKYKDMELVGYQEGASYGNACGFIHVGDYCYAQEKEKHELLMKQKLKELVSSLGLEEAEAESAADRGAKAGTGEEEEVATGADLFGDEEAEAEANAEARIEAEDRIEAEERIKAGERVPVGQTTHFS